MGEKLHLEIDGRQLDENEDGSITITLSRLDTLEAASQLYYEYCLEKTDLIFGLWLDKQIAKERGKKILIDYPKQ